ncbi:6448_t:CDS:2 [Diversispora eburnea]|uniref:6448_t:CDS:1 n=1 Tax=Diversispora eburnea TaxID=1213867 RepID=A0A9N9BNV4_9GLOM|nr:6448_t:CDS:2 [Diversispora eburnea]
MNSKFVVFLCTLFTVALFAEALILDKRDAEADANPNPYYFYYYKRDAEAEANPNAYYYYERDTEADAEFIHEIPQSPLDDS